MTYSKDPGFESAVVETYWVLTNHALTAVFFRVTSEIVLSASEVAALIGQVFDTVTVVDHELYPVVGAGFGYSANLGNDGHIVVLVTRNESLSSKNPVIRYDFTWNPPDRNLALQETPEFLEAERRAERLISLLAILFWRRVGGVISDLDNYEIDPVELEESIE